MMSSGVRDDIIVMRNLARLQILVADDTLSSVLIISMTSCSARLQESGIPPRLLN